MSEPGETKRSDAAGLWKRFHVVIIAAVALALGFGGGFLIAKPNPQNPEASGPNWPFFGKPRAANAKRAAPKRPDGFAVWTSRIDTSGPEPRACIRMSKPLDANQSYGDYVLISPQIG